MADRTLYYGDNLHILERHILPNSVDLVYLDPPFKSNQDYNVLFAEKNGSQSSAQIRAFEDTWQWTMATAEAWADVVERGGRPSEAMQAFRQLLGENDMLAYLSMMAPRLVALRRVLKPTGSIYLHCDPTASHYLKILLDSIFGPKRFLNEITWKRTGAHSDTKQGMKRCGRIRDIILVYSKSENYTWNTIYTEYTDEYLESEYKHETADGEHYKETDATAAKPGGDTEYKWPVKRRSDRTGARWEPDLNEEFKQPKPGWEYKAVGPYRGRYWAYSKANLTRFWQEGRLIHRKTGMPRIMHFAKEMPGIPLQNLWDDIPPELGKRDLGYPTQKPTALLERIVQASSNPGDTVLDPFCGCGTAIEAAEKLERRWIGIDITHLAIALIKHRLHDAFGEGLDYEVLGEPVSLPDAKALAKQDRHQFELWALGLVKARPLEAKKGADRGIDGRLYFHDEGKGGKTKQAIFQVKSGKLQPAYVRDLRGVVEREKAQIGALISLNKPTAAMRKEAASAGFYESPWGKHPKIQLLTIEDLLGGKELDYPKHADATFKRAPKHKKKAGEQPTLRELPQDD
ncbi:MAG TPA: DNA methyltransferase [Acidobacteriota bacterium]|nr:DNA methyltransferase [Acidobacteriota bacterium]